jgi:hypothetical protein
MIFRKCKICGENLPFTLFNVANPNKRTKRGLKIKGRAGTWGLVSKCRACNAKYAKDRRELTGRKTPPQPERNAAISKDWAWRLTAHRPKISRESLRDKYGQQEGLCYWSGVPMCLEPRTRRGKVDPSSITVDRLDPGGEYVDENIVLACSAMNTGRSNCPVGEWDGFLERAGRFLVNRPKNRLRIKPGQKADN